ncbi:MAG: site-2 protease family protein [Methyloversatilis sp.]|jgi:Zn-dependent protease|nr:site-2 protease family protein [Methyloversatilis sp.]MBP6193043.1 site-2 protease family protein [Methyloversatilis sp.]MBP9116889.1 site-2 protease family protein [Methyloversatilis sp.]
MDDVVARLAIIVLPVVLAITLHEAAHGYAALLKGDPTAQRAGRISANPFRHIDPVGTVLVPLVMYFGAAMLGQPGLLFGWAKPVPVNFSLLRRPKQDMLWVAAAGPGANLVMALFWGLAYKFALSASPQYFGEPLMLMAEAGILINLLLMVLNLLPIPPLDGGRIMVSILPPGLSMAFARLEPYGLVLLLGLLLTGVLDSILRPLLTLAKTALMSLLF